METETPKKFDFIALLFLILSVIGISMCYDFLFIPVMVVLPALCAAAVFRSRHTVPAFLMLFLFTVIYGLLLGYELLFTLRIVLLTMPSTLLLYIAHAYRLGNTQAALYLSVSITFGFFAVFCLNSLHMGKPAFYEVQALFQNMFNTISANLPADSTVYITLNEYVSNIDIYFPSVLYSFGAVYGLTNVLLLHAFNKRKHLMPLVPMRPFGQWRLPRPYVLVCVIIMGASLILSYIGSYSSRVDMVLLLANYMLNMPLCVVGAGMLFSLFTRRGKNAGMIVLYVVIIALLLMFGIALYALSILGFLGSIGKRRPVSKE